MTEKQTTRKNHYVPQWYQRGFLPPGTSKLFYLNLSPDTISLPNGSTKTHRALSHNATSQCFYKTDLYSTFFGPHINDEIERELFGDIDRKGACAVRAFLGDDIAASPEHFQDLFVYLDAQKLRTPKGLGWIKTHYSKLEQNVLMAEMQEIRTSNCVIWSESVRETVSAKNSAVKFIISDHPITIYNCACPPDHELCVYPNDPAIALKGSQTVFALNQEHCLILTNLQYAEEPETTDLLEKRTFARNIRESWVRTDTFIRQRDLNEDEVIAINYLLKKRAGKYIASENEQWLYPEKHYNGTWSDLKSILLPPKDKLWQYGGEIWVGFGDGSVDYQDAYGRKTPKTNALDKYVDEAKLGCNDPCGCGSGKKYKKCCKSKPKKQRPTWDVRSIRERNIFFFRQLERILEMETAKDWADVFKKFDETKVKKIYELYSFLWPPETEIFELLPKPDGATRAVYSEFLDPLTTPFITANVNLYFGELLVQNPFSNHNLGNRKISPIEHPHCYLIQTLKSVFIFLQLFPFIKSGHINLFPDPCSLDPFLQRDMINTVKKRSSEFTHVQPDHKIFGHIQPEDFLWFLSVLPKDAQKRIENGQLIAFPVAPNFEMLLFMAQATGSFVVTDSHHRWSEFQAASHRENSSVATRLPDFETLMASSNHRLVSDSAEAHAIRKTGKLGEYRRSIDDLVKRLSGQESEINVDSLGNDFQSARETAQQDIKASTQKTTNSRFHFLAPKGGIYHNNVQRLMVRYGIEDRPKQVSLAVLIDVRQDIKGRKA